MFLYGQGVLLWVHRGGSCHSGLMTCSLPPLQLWLVYGSLVLW
jgi:hypothetical protein